MYITFKKGVVTPFLFVLIQMMLVLIKLLPFNILSIIG